MAPGVSSWLKRTLIFVHRWLGVALCSLFLLWFPSGIAMMYWDFPAVTAEDRLQHSSALDPSQILVSPQQAFAAVSRLTAPRDVRLNTFDGRPVYDFPGWVGGCRAVGGGGG